MGMGIVIVHLYSLWVLIFSIIGQLHSNYATAQNFSNNNTVLESLSRDAKPNNSNYILGIEPLPFDSAWGIPGWRDDDDFENWVPPREFVKNFPYYFSGFDKDNRPVGILEIGRYDVAKFVIEANKTEECTKYIRRAAYVCIKALSIKSTKEKPVNGGIVIVDLEGLQPAQIANPQGETLINLGRSIFGRVTAQVETYGTNKANYEPQLLKSIPKDQLPEWYGGEKNHKPVYVFG